MIAYILASAILFFPLLGYILAMKSKIDITSSDIKSKFGVMYFPVNL